mmetsp:Transcript_12819/g.15919  ORF Transcript_12819/g.15919 Transcript_12819/m.15919 type:complete len:83 (+) Transcript_12819:381-629(+)
MRLPVFYYNRKKVLDHCLHVTNPSCSLVELQEHHHHRWLRQTQVSHRVVNNSEKAIFLEQNSEKEKHKPTQCVHPFHQQRIV